MNRDILGKKTIVFTDKDQTIFSDASHDKSPLHTSNRYARKTAYGQRLGFGYFGALACLGQLKKKSQCYICRLEIEFRNPIFIGVEYHFIIDDEDSEVTVVNLCEGNQVLVQLKAFFSKSLGKNSLSKSEKPLVFSQFSPLSSSREYQEKEFLNEIKIEESYRVNEKNLAKIEKKFFISESIVEPLHMDLFMLFSYLVGMEFPGKNSLCAKLDLFLEERKSTSHQLLKYKAFSRSYDPSYGLLDININISDSKGFLAKGELKAFVRKEIPPVPVSTIQNLLIDVPKEDFQGKIVLVIGGSRGLGATIAQAFSLQGAHVIINFDKSLKEAQSLQEKLEGTSGTLTLLQGDARDQQWCEKAKNTILKKFKRLDFLVCNACSSPDSSPSSLAARQKYIAENLALMSSPLSVFIDSLQAVSGNFIGISSFVVEKENTDRPHYKSLKLAVEELVQSEVKRYPNILFSLVRPPILLTDMSNMPMRILNALPPETIAVSLITHLSKQLPPGKLNILNNFSENSSAKEVNFKLPSNAQLQSKDILTLASTFTIDPILEGIEFWTKELDLPLQAKIAPYNQIFQELLSKESMLGKNQKGLNVIFLRFEDWCWFLEEKTSQKDKISSKLKAHLKSTLVDLITALRTFSETSYCHTLLLLCPSSPSYNNVLWESLFRQLEDKLFTETSKFNGLLCRKLEDFHDLYKTEEIHDPLRDEIGYIPYIPEYFHTMATIVIRQYYMLNNRYKVIVVDCDNTLWQGVCGEVGVEGIVVEEAFLKWQSFLIKQHKQGMLLCLCSKNNPEDVWNVFLNKGSMLLKKEHIVDSRINWSLKSENLKSLAQSLNLGLDSFIFIDDNPLECSEVRSHCPEVLTIEWKKETIVPLLDHLWIFDRFSVTKEDKKRTQMYKEEKERGKLKEKSTDFASFLKSLALCIEIEPIGEKDLLRVSQLTQRTNQFNFTTIRRSQGEIQQLIVAENQECWGVKVRDRFGDYGLVGVLIFEFDFSTLILDSFMLSCRVLGRGVEHHMMTKLGEIAKERKSKEIQIIFKPSSKNDPAKQFFEQIAKKQKTEVAEGQQFICPPEYLQKIRYQVPTTSQALQKTKSTVSISSPSIRKKEQQLLKIARDLSSAKDLLLAVTAQEKKSSKTFTSPAIFAKNEVSPSISEEIKTGNLYQETLRKVKGIFSKALSIKTTQLDLNIELENYVEDSFKTVEVTVELKKEFPKLPATFLFEHRTLQSIVDDLVKNYAFTSYNHLDGGQDSSPPKEKELFYQKTSLESDPFVEPNSVNTLPLQGGDIAVIGMSGKYSNATTLGEFWENLKAGNSSISGIPENRWNSSSFFPFNEIESTKSYSKWGGFLDNVDSFDAAFFHISPKEAEVMDPQQRLFLEVVWGLLEDAGYNPQTFEKNTSVFVGVVASDYEILTSQSLKGIESHRNCDYYQIANRISYFFDLHGPSISLDTACSSSGTAIHLACKSLKEKECEVAIVGGTNLFLYPSRFIQYSQMQMLSPDGKCCPFGADANGTVFGEGVGALLLKPLKSAERDQDNIYGVIKASAINSGGKTKGFTVPNPQAQAQVVSEALHKAKIDPQTINYLEAHGTGTSLGDPIEVRGLSSAFQKNNKKLKKQYCAIGSIKANIGHLESCAAIAGITKVLLQMKYKKLVPSLNAIELNPLIPFEESPFYVQRNLSDWERVTQKENGIQRTYPLRAGVSSFGAGGSNSHIILEEYLLPEKERKLENNQPHLIVLSAKNGGRLKSIVQELGVFLADKNSKDLILSDIAYTLQVGRAAMNERLALVVNSISHLLEKLTEYSNEKSAREGFYEGNIKVDRDKKKLFSEKLGKKTVKSIMNNKELDEIAQMWVSGTEIDWELLHKESKPRRLSLPTYSFARERYWIKKTSALSSKVGSLNVIHPLLHENTSDLLEHRFSSRFTGKEFFLRDHEVKGKKFLLWSGYLEMARVAVERASGELEEGMSVCLKNVVWLETFFVNESVELVKEVHVGLFEENKRQISYDIYTGSEEEVTFHCQGIAEFKIKEERSRLNTKNIASKIEEGENQVLKKLSLPFSLEDRQKDYVLHPYLMDCALEASLELAKSIEGNSKSIELYALESLEVIDSCTKEMYAWVRYSENRKLDIDLCDEEGNVCVKMKGVSCRVRERKQGTSSVKNLQETSTLNMYKELWRSGQETMPSFLFSGQVVYIGIEDKVERKLKEQMAQEGIKWHSVTQVSNGLQKIKRAKESSKLVIIYRPKGEEKSANISDIFRLLNACNSKVEQVILVGSYKSAYDQSWIGYERSMGLVRPDLKITILYDVPKAEVIAKSIGRTGVYRYGKEQEEQLSFELLDSSGVKEGEIKKEGLYVITGGMGGLGQLFAKYLAQKYHAKLVLVGRSKKNTKHELMLEELIKAGASSACYEEIDVKDKKKLEALAEEIELSKEKIRGVIHAAGMEGKKQIGDASWAEFERVLCANIEGTNAVNSAFNRSDWICYFSSSAAILGDFGSCSYAIGKRYQMAVSVVEEDKGEKEKPRYIAINWPLWKEGGMGVGDEEATELYLKSSGQRWLRAEEGLAAFETILSKGYSQALVMMGEENRIRNLLERKYKGKEGKESQGREKARSGDREKKVEGKLWRSELRGIEIEGCVKKDVEEMVERLLKIPVEQIEDEENLADFGFDSITLGEFSEELSNVYEIDLTPGIFFSYTNLFQLRKYLLSTYRTELTKLYQAPGKEEKTKDILVAAVEKESKGIKRQRRKRLGGRRLGKREEIAIVGVSGRFPGAETVEEFWELLVSEKCSVKEIPESRWGRTSAYYDASGESSSKSYSKWGGLLRGIDRFDPLFFEISPREAEYMAPEERLFLMEAYHALEDANLNTGKLSKKKVGVFVGMEESSYKGSGEEKWGIVSGGAAMISSHLSYFLDFRGPTIATNTACSSGLVAFHQACVSLQTKESDIGLAGGITILSNPFSYVMMSQVGMLSKDGKCHTFSKDANGIVCGESVVVVVLKRLSDAEEGGDNIYGKVKSTGINFDGKTNGVTAPSGTAQAALIRETYEQGEIEVEDLGYIVTHGTGTKLGDPVEINALREVFKDRTSKEQYCALTSNKPNLGHTLAASGLVNVVNLLLAMKHKMIPGSLHCEKENDYIDWKKSPFYVNKTSKAWECEEGKRRLGGVSAFGRSGTNAHVVIEEYINNVLDKRENNEKREENGGILVLSAKRENELSVYVENIYKYIKSHQEVDLAGILHTFQVGREEMKCRLAIVVCDREQLLRDLKSTIEGKSSTFVFRGVINKKQRLSIGETKEEKEFIKELIQKHRFNKIAELWVNGAYIDWERCYGADSMKLLSGLPTYPFAKERYWSEETSPLSFLVENLNVIHPLLHENTSDLSKLEFGTSFPEKQFLSRNYSLNGFVFNGSKLDRRNGPKRVGLPPYSFARGRYWIEETSPLSFQVENLNIVHPLLHKNTSDLSKLEFGTSLLEKEFSSSNYYLNGFILDWSKLDKRVEPRLISLPSHSFAKKRCWFKKAQRLGMEKRETKQVFLKDSIAEKKPMIFILSTPRSGSTLLRVMLTGHSQLFAPPELYLSSFRSMQEREQWALENKHFAMDGGLLQTIMKLEGISEKESMAKLKDFKKRDLTIEQVYQYIEKFIGDCYLVDKTPLNIESVSRFINQRQQGSRNAFYIHLTRNPLSVMESLIRNRIRTSSASSSASTNNKERDPWVEGAKQWGQVNKNIEKFLTTVSPEKQFHIRYEDLVQNPEKIMDKLCFHLGLPLEQDMLEPYKGDKMIKGTRGGMTLGDPNFNKHKKIDTLSIHNWQKHTDKLSLLSSEARELAQRFGYLQEEQLKSPILKNNSLLEKTTTDNDDLLKKIQNHLRKDISDIGQIDLEDIELDAYLSEYGFDSIMTNKLTNKINEKYDLELTPVIFFEFPTIALFTEYIKNEYQENFMALATKSESFSRQTAIPSSMNALEETLANERIEPESLANKLPVKAPLTSKQSSCDIAIIGMAGVVPGCKSLFEFWENLSEGKDLITEVPLDRWDWRKLQENSKKEGETNFAKWGGFIFDIDKFDPLFFKISPAEAELMDPQQRIFLQTVWHTLEDAGYTPSGLSGLKIGLFVGVANSRYSRFLLKSNNAYYSTGNSQSILANRISYILNFTGPSEPVNTACSASLVAIHRAVRSIQTGDCDQAIAGGVNALLHVNPYSSLAKAGMFSPDGRCKAFSKDANGYVRAEGAGAILLKSLFQAQQDNDHIYAVIKGSSINHGGQVSSLTVPNPNAIAQVLTSACEESQITPETITYIEAHGTGTSLGDPIEIRGFKKAFGKQNNKHYCAIGSVKSNIGHLETASGIASVIKVLLSLKYKKIPKTLHAKELNPYLQLEDTPFYINQTTKNWEKISESIPRRAGISSFGFGGSNAHLLIEEYDDGVLPESTGAHAIVLSAKTETQLKIYAKDLLNHLQQQPKLPLVNIAYTLQVGREAMEERLGLIANSLEELQEKLEVFLSGNKEIEECYRGQIKRDKEILARFTADEGFQQTIDSWMNERIYSKLLGLWVKGLLFDWNELYKEVKPKRISLPTYPFVKKRFWISQLNEKSNSSVLPNSEFSCQVTDDTTSKPIRLLRKLQTKASPTQKIYSEKEENGASLKEKVAITLTFFVSKLLKFKVEEINSDVELSEYGLDSITLSEFINKINEKYKIELLPTIFFEYPTIDSFADYLLQEHLTAVTKQVQTVEKGTAPSEPSFLKSNSHFIATSTPLVSSQQKKEFVPASIEQERIWFLHQHQASYCVNYSLIPFSEEINPSSLERTFSHILTRYPILSTNFCFREGKLEQKSSSLSLKIEKIDLRNLEDPDLAIEKLIKEKKNIPFDLSSELPWQVCWVDMNLKRQYLLLLAHPIIADSFSLNLISKEAVRIYSSLQKGEKIEKIEKELPSLKKEISYQEWQQKMQKEDEQEAKLYWKNQLKECPVLQIKSEQNWGSEETSTFHIEKDLFSSLSTLVEKENISLSLLFLTAFKVLLHRLSGQNDMILGTYFARQEEEKNLVGPVGNIFPIRSKFKEEISFNQFISQIKELVQEGEKHRFFPFVKMITNKNIQRFSKRSSIFQAFFTMEFESPLEESSFSGLHFFHDISLCARKKKETIQFQFFFHSGLFSEQEILELQKQWIYLLEQISENFEKKISDYSLLTKNFLEVLGKDFSSVNDPSKAPRVRKKEIPVDERERGHFFLWQKKNLAGWGERALVYFLSEGDFSFLLEKEEDLSFVKLGEKEYYVYQLEEFGRYNIGGTIDFCGRKENQVVYQGTLIDIEKIEQSLKEHPKVENCAIVLKGSTHQEKELVVFTLFKETSRKLVLNSLLDFVKERNPTCLIPLKIVQLKTFPFSEGQINKKVLAEINTDDVPRITKTAKAQNSLEVLLQDICLELFDLNQIGLQDNFFDLGADSLWLICLQEKLQKDYSMIVPLSLILKHPSIDKLAYEINKRSKEKTSSPFVLIKPEGRKNFFFFHGDFSGSGYYCYKMRKYLSEEISFYSVPPHNFFNSDKQPETIHEMANDYLSALLEIQKEGPYYIGGFCNGASVALEIARILEETSTVAQVILLDIPFMKKRKWLYNLASFYSKLVGASELEKQNLYHSLMIKQNPEKRAVQRAMIFPDLEKKSKLSPQESQIYLSHIYGRILSSHFLEPIQSPLTLVFSDKENDTFESKKWQNLSPTLTTKRIPGDHLTCITEHVDTFAKVIDESFKDEE